MLDNVTTGQQVPKYLVTFINTLSCIIICSRSLPLFRKNKLLKFLNLLIFLQIFESFKTCKSILFSVIHNSFPDELARRSFYQNYYQILIHGKFPMKERKLPLVSPPDSGKTSWYAPFQDEHYIYFNTFKVMLSRKDLFRLLYCVFGVQFIQFFL